MILTSPETFAEPPMADSVFASLVTLAIASAAVIVAVMAMPTTISVAEAWFRPSVWTVRDPVWDSPVAAAGIVPLKVAVVWPATVDLALSRVIAIAAAATLLASALA